MTTPKILGRGKGGSAQRVSSGLARVQILLVLAAAAAAAAALAACNSAAASSPSSPGPSASSPAAVAASTVKTATIGGATVLTNSKGFTLYSFAPTRLPSPTATGRARRTGRRCRDR